MYYDKKKLSPKIKNGILLKKYLLFLIINCEKPNILITCLKLIE